MAAVTINKAIGFIGAGQMAEALAKGFIKKNVLKANNIYCTDISQGRMDLFKDFGAVPKKSGKEVVESSEVIFIAVKPQFVSKVLIELQPSFTEKHIIVSIAAGITLETLLKSTGNNVKMIRVMPNTPCLVGETASALCYGGKATEEDASIIINLMSAVGMIVSVDEKLMSAVTGLSGSGPAYIFIIIEALADGGVRAGLPRDVAMKLAAQTVLGSAKMVLESGKHPGALKDMVTSPGGTTIAAVHELEKNGIRNSMMDAVLAAAKRADELSKTKM